MVRLTRAGPYTFDSIWVIFVKARLITSCRYGAINCSCLKIGICAWYLTVECWNRWKVDRLDIKLFVRAPSFSNLLSWRRAKTGLSESLTLVDTVLNGALGDRNRCKRRIRRRCWRIGSCSKGALPSERDIFKSHRPRYIEMIVGIQDVHCDFASWALRLEEELIIIRWWINLLQLWNLGTQVGESSRRRVYIVCI